MNATGQASAAFAVSFDGAPDQAPELYLIAVDGVFIDNSRWNNEEPTTVLFMAPGNRVDFLVRAGTQGNFSLRARPSLPNQQRQSGQQGQGTPAPTPTPTPPTPLLSVNVVGTLPTPMQLPPQLPTLPFDLRPISDSEIVGQRTLTFSLLSGQVGEASKGNAPVYAIDGKLFDPCVVNQCMVVNTAEEWTIVNTTPVAHPFHIHLNPFVITDFEDPTPNDPNNPRLTGDDPVGQWQDTIIVPARANGQNGSVTFRHRFPEITGKFVLHCHILGHEDRGMMQVVEVVESADQCQASTC